MRKQALLTDSGTAALTELLTKNPKAKLDEVTQLMADHNWFGGHSVVAEKLSGLATRIRTKLGLTAPRRKRAAAGQRSNPAGAKTPTRAKTPSVVAELPLSNKLCFCPQCGFDLESLRRLMTIVEQTQQDRGDR